MIGVQNLRKSFDARLAVKGLSFQASNGTITNCPAGRDRSSPNRCRKTSAPPREPTASLSLAPSMSSKSDSRVIRPHDGSDPLCLDAVARYSQVTCGSGLKADWRRTNVYSLLWNDGGQRRFCSALLTFRHPCYRDSAES